MHCERNPICSRSLTDLVPDFVRAEGLAGLAWPGVVDGDDPELPLAVLGQVGHRERRARHRGRVHRGPAAPTLHRAFLDLVACKGSPGRECTVKYSIKKFKRVCVF